jgi:hypothetical protein
VKFPEEASPNFESFRKAVGAFPPVDSPHFMKESLQRNLLSGGIQYLYLGKELGGFRKGGYPAYRETDSFQKGLDRLFPKLFFQK